MPYVQRDGSGNIIAIYGAEQDNVKEHLDDDHPDIVKFLHDRRLPGAPSTPEKPPTPDP